MNATSGMEGVKWLLSVLLVVCISSLFAQSDRHQFSKIPPIHNYNTDDYDGGIQNWSIQQSSRGFIYVANNFGLLEFDGVSWRRYTVPRGTRTQSIYIDQSDRIYVGGQNAIGYFAPSPDGFLIYTNLLPLIPDGYQVDNIWNIYEQDGKIYFKTDNAVFAYDGDVIVDFHFDSELNFLLQASGQLFLHAYNTGVYEFRGDSFIEWTSDPTLSEKTLVEILPHKNNSFLIFTAEGEIYLYKDDFVSQWSPTLDRFFQNTVVSSAILLSDNTIAIGTQNKGVVIVNDEGQPIMHLTIDQGLNSNTVLSLFEDQFDNLWLGLNNGIAYAELGLPFSFIDRSVGITGSGYSAVYSDNQLYLGTNTGLYYQESRPTVISSEDPQYSLVEGSEGQVYNVRNIRDDMWMGHHTGAFRLLGARSNKVGDEFGTWDFRPIPKSNEIIAGTYNGFSIYSSDGELLKNLEGFSETSRLFQFSYDTVLWMTHGFKGAYKLSLDPNDHRITQVGFYGENKGFPSNLLINVFKLGSDLVFTAETGIFTYDAESDSFRSNVELEEHLGSDVHVSNMTMDTHGNVYYMINNNTVGILRKELNKFQKDEDTFRRINKYISDDLQNITIIDSENILIGAKEGFIHYNPSIPRNRVEAFNSFIRSVRILPDDSVVYNGAADQVPDLNLSFKNNSIVIDFVAPYFDGNEDISYQYRLEDFDEEWSEWSGATSKAYTNLPAGEFQFQVKARNIYGLVSDPVTFVIEVSPPWYLTRVAYSLYVVLILAIFGTVLFRLDSRHKVDKEQIVASSNKEISDLRNEKLQSEIDHKNRELTSSTMHLLNKNEIMLGIKSSLEDIIEESTNKASLKKIIKTIETSIEDDRDWDQFTQYFDQVHGDFLKRIKEQYPDITPQETRLAAFLRMNLSSKNIAQLINISVRGVEIGRYRLRKKLQLERDTNLTSFLMDF